VRHLKRRVLDDTRAILSAEVREEHLDTFQRDIRAVLSEVKPIVRENAKAVRCEKDAEQDRTLEEIAREGEPQFIVSVLFEYLDNLRDFEIAYSVFDEKFAKLSVRCSP